MRIWLEAERAWMEERLREIGVTYFPSEANLSAFKKSVPAVFSAVGRKISDPGLLQLPGAGERILPIAIKQRVDNERLLAALTRIYKGGKEPWQHRS